MAASRDSSSGRAYIASASIIVSSEFETIALREYNPAGVEADKSIVGIGRSALISSINAAMIRSWLE